MEKGEEGSGPSTTRPMLLLYSFYMMSFCSRFPWGRQECSIYPPSAPCASPSSLQPAGPEVLWGCFLLACFLCILYLVMPFVTEGEEREGCGFLTEVGKHLPGRSPRMSYVAICMTRWLHTLQCLLWKVFVWHS